MTPDVTKGTVICTNGDSSNTMLRLGGVIPMGVSGFDLSCSAKELQKLSCSFVGNSVGFAKDPDLNLDSLKEKYEFVFVNSNGVGATANVFWKGQKIVNAISVEIHVAPQWPVSIKLQVYETPNDALPTDSSYITVERVKRPDYKLGTYAKVA